MSALTAVLRAGSQVCHDGAAWVVAEFCGRRLLLASGDGRLLRQVEVGWLLAHPTTHLPIDVDESSSGLPSGSAGAVFGGLDATREQELRQRVEHVQEMLTGFRRGDADLALPGEPRPQYAPGVARMDRYQAKAAELGVGLSTLRRWAAAFAEHGPQGLLPAHSFRAGWSFATTDPRWIDACQQVLAAHVNGSRPTKALVLSQVEALLDEQYGPRQVRLPSKSAGYHLLSRLSKGTNAFDGSAKGKRSIASRPPGVYGRLRATRPGEYVLLDTTRLDVYAMEPLTCRWVQADLSVAMDLFSRCIVGLRLTPVSTRAADVAAVLYETVRPDPDERALPAAGVPGTVVVPAHRLVDHADWLLLPSAAAETVVFDHGRVYLSEHLRSVCATLGVSLQPARPRTPTDKSPLERWFKTLSEGLLVALPGYKGADVHSRGLDVENQAFFFLPELEAIIRQWITQVYHVRQHRSLSVPQIPGLRLSPLEMFEHGINRAGYLSILHRPDLAYDFLAVRWVKTIQHYGVQIAGLRYHAEVLTKYRNMPSPYEGVHAGWWPFSVDPGDVTRVFFCDPADHSWHACVWEHAGALGQPLSEEALAYARRLAAATHRFPDTKRAAAELLARWGAGLTEGATERRIALRMATHDPVSPDGPVAPRQRTAETMGEGAPGDDTPPPPQWPTAEPPQDPERFYADVMDSD